MSILYETTGNEIDPMGYTSLNGYTMHRERYVGKGWTWVLRDPSGEFVDKDTFRSAVAHRNGFELDYESYVP